MGGDHDEAMGPTKALATIEWALAFDEHLRSRTEGLTWVLWGFVTTTMTLTTGALNDIFGWYDAGGWRQQAAQLGWLPWVVVGAVGTWALWRTAGLRWTTNQRTADAVRASAVWLASVVVIWFLLTYVAPGSPAGVAAILLGAIWLLLGILNPYRATRSGRRTLAVIGSTIAVAGLIFLLVLPEGPSQGWTEFNLFGAFVGGGVPILAGLWQSLLAARLADTADPATSETSVHLDPVIHQATRLQILANLFRNRSASFTGLRDGLALSPGNLATHTTRLEDAGYIRKGRVLTGARFEVRYRLTDEGLAAFRAYLDSLHDVLAEATPPDASASPRAT